MCMMIDQKQGTVQRFVPKQMDMEWWVSTRSGRPRVCMLAREPSRFLKLWNCTDCGSQCTMMEEHAWQTVSQPGGVRVHMQTCCLEEMNRPESTTLD